MHDVDELDVLIKAALRGIEGRVLEEEKGLLADIFSDLAEILDEEALADIIETSVQDAQGNIEALTDILNTEWEIATAEHHSMVGRQLQKAREIKKTNSGGNHGNDDLERTLMRVIRDSAYFGIS